MAQVRLSDAIAVVVHTNVITARDIDIRIAPAVEVLYKQYSDKPDELNKRAMAIRREAIESLVEKELVLQDFKDSKLVLPQNYVDDEVVRRIRTAYGDRLTLIRTLRAQGETYDRFCEEIRNELIFKAMYGKYVNSINQVSPQMILNYYNDHKADYKVEDMVRMRIIMLLKEGRDVDTIKSIGNEILSQIKGGADFAEMVEVYSEDRQIRGREDAHLEWRDRVSMQPELANKAFSMQPGEVSDLVETDAAVWIIKLEDVKPAHTRGIDEVRESIETIIRDEMQARLKKNWIERLKKKYLVRYY